MTVMHNDCLLGKGGEFRRSTTAKILDDTDTESGDFLAIDGNGNQTLGACVVEA